MSQLLVLYLVLCVALASLILGAVQLFRSPPAVAPALERALRDELRAAGEEHSASARSLRDELGQAGKASADTLVRLVGELRDSQAAQLVTLGGSVRSALEEQRALLQQAAEADSAAAQVLRDEVTTALCLAREQMVQLLTQLSSVQQVHLEAMSRRLAELTESLQLSSQRQGEKLGEHLKELQEGNEKKLEEMRLTVDEKLHGTLEKRLGESFALVSERLEAVQGGWGNASGCSCKNHFTDRI